MTKTPADFLKETSDPRRTIDSIEQMQNMYPCLHTHQPEFWVGLIMVGGEQIHKWRKEIDELIVRTYFNRALSIDIDHCIKKLGLLVEYVLKHKQSCSLILLGKCRLWEISLHNDFITSLPNELRLVNIYPH
jgi:hypothetical protein